MANAPSEADMGSMKGYNPNLGLPKNQVPNSGFTPKVGPLAPRGGTSPLKMMGPKRGTSSRMPGSTRAMAPGMKSRGIMKSKSAFTKMKGRAGKGKAKK